MSDERMKIERKPLWSVTTWDKKFNAVAPGKQRSSIKYHYLLAADLKSKVVAGGDVKLLTTNETDLWTTEDRVEGLVSEGEVVTIPWGGNPNVQYYKGRFVTADNRIATSSDVKVLDNKYLYYFMLANKDVIGSYYRGAGLKHPEMAKVLDMEIPLPPVAQQQKVVRRFDGIVNLIAKRKEQLAKLDQLVKSRFVEMFGDPVSNTGGWPTDFLGNRCEITTGNTPPRSNPSNYGDFLEWVKSDNIVDGRLTEARECLSEHGARLSRRAAAGSLLMTCIAGSLNSIGNVAVIDREVAFNQQLNAITPKCDDPYFLMWMFKLARSLLHDGINKCLKGILSKGTLSNKRFPFPPLALQREFAAFVAEVDKSEFAVRKRLEKARQLYRAKLQEYFG